MKKYQPSFTKFVNEYRQKRKAAYIEKVIFASAVVSMALYGGSTVFDSAIVAHAEEPDDDANTSGSTSQANKFNDLDEAKDAYGEVLDEIYGKLKEDENGDPLVDENGNLTGERVGGGLEDQYQETKKVLEGTKDTEITGAEITTEVKGSTETYLTMKKDLKVLTDEYDDPDTTDERKAELAGLISSQEADITDLEQNDATLKALQSDYGKNGVLAVAEEILNVAVDDFNTAKAELGTAITDWTEGAAADLDEAIVALQEAVLLYEGDTSDTALAEQTAALTALDALKIQLAELDETDPDYDVNKADLENQIIAAEVTLANADLVVLGALGNFNEKQKIADEAKTNYETIQAEAEALKADYDHTQEQYDDIMLKLHDAEIAYYGEGGKDSEASINYRTTKGVLEGLQALDADEIIEYNLNGNYADDLKAAQANFDATIHDIILQGGALGKFEDAVIAHDEALIALDEANTRLTTVQTSYKAAIDLLGYTQSDLASFQGDPDNEDDVIAWLGTLDPADANTLLGMWQNMADAKNTALEKLELVNIAYDDVVEAAKLAGEAYGAYEAKHDEAKKIFYDDKGVLDWYSQGTPFTILLGQLDTYFNALNGTDKVNDIYLNKVLEILGCADWEEVKRNYTSSNEGTLQGSKELANAVLEANAYIEAMTKANTDAHDAFEAFQKHLDDISKGDLTDFIDNTGGVKTKLRALYDAARLAFKALDEQFKDTDFETWFVGYFGGLIGDLLTSDDAAAIKNALTEATDYIKPVAGSSEKAQIAVRGTNSNGTPTNASSQISSSTGYSAVNGELYVWNGNSIFSSWSNNRVTTGTGDNQTTPYMTMINDGHRSGSGTTNHGTFVAPDVYHAMYNSGADKTNDIKSGYVQLVSNGGYSSVDDPNKLTKLHGDRSYDTFIYGVVTDGEGNQSRTTDWVMKLEPMGGGKFTTGVHDDIGGARITLKPGTSVTMSYCIMGSNFGIVELVNNTPWEMTYDLERFHYHYTAFRLNYFGESIEFDGAKIPENLEYDFNQKKPDPIKREDHVVGAEVDTPDLDLLALPLLYQSNPGPLEPPTIGDPPLFSDDDPDDPDDPGDPPTPPGDDDEDPDDPPTPPGDPDDPTPPPGDDDDDDDDDNIPLIPPTTPPTLGDDPTNPPQTPQTPQPPQLPQTPEPPQAANVATPPVQVPPVETPAPDTENFEAPQVPLAEAPPELASPPVEEVDVEPADVPLANVEVEPEAEPEPELDVFEEAPVPLGTIVAPQTSDNGVTPAVSAMMLALLGGVMVTATNKKARKDEEEADENA